MSSYYRQDKNFEEEDTNFRIEFINATSKKKFITDSLKNFKSISNWKHILKIVIQISDVIKKN